MESKKNSTNEIIYKTNRVTNVENKHGYQGESWSRGKLGDWDCHIHSTIYKIGN